MLGLTHRHEGSFIQDPVHEESQRTRNIQTQSHGTPRGREKFQEAYPGKYDAGHSRLLSGSTSQDTPDQFVPSEKASAGTYKNGKHGGQGSTGSATHEGQSHIQLLLPSALNPGGCGRSACLGSVLDGISKGLQFKIRTLLYQWRNRYPRHDMPVA